MKKYPKIILLKGNGPISINNELMELYTITTSHGLIGLPLKTLRADKVCIVETLEKFWEIEKTIKDKPCCFVYSYEPLEGSDLENIKAVELLKV